MQMLLERSIELATRSLVGHPAPGVLPMRSTAPRLRLKRLGLRPHGPTALRAYAEYRSSPPAAGIWQSAIGIS